MLEVGQTSAFEDRQASLLRWYASPTGEKLLHRERDFLQSRLGAIFGYQLVQLGLLGEQQIHLAASPIRGRLIVVDRPLEQSLQSQLVAHFDRLPLASDSVDLLILPHTLDMARDARLLLREVERVLIPEGRLLITGFNPWSLWGLTRLGRRLLRRPSQPWRGDFLSQLRLRDWLSLLGFDVEYTQSMLFDLPLSGDWFQRHIWNLERAGTRLCPPCGAVYGLQAVKRVSRLTPIMPLWRQKARLIGGGRVVEPTTREVNHG